MRELNPAAGNHELQRDLGGLVLDESVAVSAHHGERPLSASGEDFEQGAVCPVMELTMVGSWEGEVGALRRSSQTASDSLGILGCPQV